MGQGVSNTFRHVDRLLIRGICIYFVKSTQQNDDEFGIPMHVALHAHCKEQQTIRREKVHRKDKITSHLQVSKFSSRQ